MRMMTSCTISQDLRLRHANANARAHAVTDKVASAHDVAAMFLTSDAFRLLWRARAWAEETIFVSVLVSVALRVGGAAQTSSWPADAVWAAHAFLTEQRCEQWR